MGRGERGFTLIEVVITIAILATIVMAFSQMMSASFDVRFALSQDDKTTAKLNRAMLKISRDLEHAFLIPKADERSGDSERTVFQVVDRGDSDILRLTTLHHTSSRSGHSPGEMLFVVYEVRPDKDVQGRSHLYRGQTSTIPERWDGREPVLKRFVANVKAINFEVWDGSSWKRNGWDSTKSDQRDLLPHMVTFGVEVFSVELEEGEESSDQHELTDQMASVVHLAYSLDFNELKEGTSTLSFLKSIR